MRWLAAAVLLAASVSATGAGADPAAVLPETWYSVTDFGAAGDSATDDTAAFQAALNAASERGGVVLVPFRGPGKGYVLRRTVRVPGGVVLMGSPAGFGTDGRAAYPTPERSIHGAKILARPAPSEYEGRLKKPLFELGIGAVVRGLHIFYDEQPWPTDEEFQDPESPYHYPSFEAARASFVKDHVKPYGPTFYAPAAVNNVIEDIVCDRYYDFLIFPAGGKTFVDRIFCYGYGAAFTYIEALDVNRLSRVHCVPNAGPASPGPVLDGKTYSWIYGIVVSRPENTGVRVGRSDGYVYDDLFFFAVHTALRLGSSSAFPIVDPVTGQAYYHDEAAAKTNGYHAPYPGGGPWGEISGFKVDLCTIGVQLVWPSPLGNRISNAMIHTGFKDGAMFEAAEGTGDLKGVAKQGAFVVESTFSTANNLHGVPPFLSTNFSFASFARPDWFGPIAASLSEANGRVFLVDGDIAMRFANANISVYWGSQRLWAMGQKARRVDIRIPDPMVLGEAVDSIRIERDVSAE